MGISAELTDRVLCSTGGVDCGTPIAQRHVLENYSTGPPHLLEREIENRNG